MKYPKKYCNFLTVAEKAVTLGENVVLCVKGVGGLPPTFYLLYNVRDEAAQPTSPIYISTSSGNVHLVDENLNVVTYGDLVYNSVYNIAKINVCGSDDCCSNRTTTHFQIIDLAIEGATAASFL